MGDIPKPMLQAMLENEFLRMREEYIDASPFQYEPSSDNIVYYPNFQHTNLDLFIPALPEKLDSYRVAKHTTWTATQEGEADLNAFVTDFDPQKYQELQPEDNRIDFIFPAT